MEERIVVEIMFIVFYSSEERTWLSVHRIDKQSEAVSLFEL